MMKRSDAIDAAVRAAFKQQSNYMYDKYGYSITFFCRVRREFRKIMSAQ